MTTPETRTEGDEQRDRFRARNAELFGERARLLDRIDRSHGARKATFERKLRRLDEDIFTTNRGLAIQQLRRWRGATKPGDMEELRAVADASLWEAVCTYDLTRGPFGQWAQLSIRRGLMRAVRSIDHQTLGRADFERRPKILRATAALSDTADAGNVDAIAAAAEVPVASVRRVLGAIRLSSLDAPAHFDGDGTETVGSQCPDEDAVDVVAQMTSTIGVDALQRFGLTTLDPRELYVVTRAWGLDGHEPESLASLGTKLHVSREAARQIHNRALSRISHPITLRRIVRHRSAALAGSV